MSDSSATPNLGKNLPPGAAHHRAYVGPPERYDLVSANQFSLVTLLGLREDHYVLDIGCGSLRGGRLLLAYLLPGRYFGIEPNDWLIREAIQHEVGEGLIQLKKPTFSTEANFRLSTFERKFDFIVAQSIFTHATRSQIQTCLAEVARVLEPEGLFAVNFAQGEVNYTGDEWVYPECVCYTLDFMGALVEEHGLRCKPITWTQPNNLKWLVIYHPANEANVPDLTDFSQVPVLREQVRYLQREIQRIRSHPAIRLLLRLRSALKRPRKA